MEVIGGLEEIGVFEESDEEEDDGTEDDNEGCGGGIGVSSALSTPS